MSWRERIEAQINDCESWMVGPDGLIENLPEEKPDEWAKTMQALLDVAVAAEKQLEDAITYVYNPDTGHYDKPLHDEGLTDSLSDALDKLREVDDE